jgi:hypothetical protein
MNKIDKNITKFEDDLLINNFKRKYLGDESGYWFETKFKFPLFKHISCGVEPDNKILYFEIYHKGNEVYKKFKVENWKDCEKILKKYKFI